MSRTDRFTETQEITYHDDRIGTILKDLSVKEDKVVIADFDSLIHTAAYTGKDEYGVRNPEYTEDQYEIAQGVLDDAILGILSKIEQYFNISTLYIILKGKNNFRYKLFESYKSSRKNTPQPMVIPHLIQYVVEKYDAIQANGCEADDYCFSISKAINHQGIILSPDKDLQQIPSIIYDYNKDIWKRSSEQEAKYFLALQLCMGDSGDCVPGIPKVGIKKAEKIVHLGMTDFQYIKAIYKAYQLYYKEQAKEQMRIMYNLLKLHDINNLPQIKAKAA